MITKKVREDGIEGYEYQMPSTCGFGEVVIKTRAEVGGHGCLFGIDLPSQLSISGMCWEGDSKSPELKDFLRVLDSILSDYHSEYHIVKGIFESLS